MNYVCFKPESVPSKWQHLYVDAECERLSDLLTKRSKMLALHVDYRYIMYNAEYRQVAEAFP